MNKEKKKRSCANTLSTGEVPNPTLKYQSLRRQGHWKYKAYSRLMMLIRSVAFLSAFPMFLPRVVTVVTCDKQAECVIAAFLLSSVSLQIRN